MLSPHNATTACVSTIRHGCSSWAWVQDKANGDKVLSSHHLAEAGTLNVY